MQETIDQARANFTQAKSSLARALETTPDDRINWSPSPTARTILGQVAHAAMAVTSIHEQLNGKPFGIKTTSAADKSFREWEGQFTTREEVMKLLEESGLAYIAWLDALTPERLDTKVESPFGLGWTPLAVAIEFPADHMNWHVAQIHYMQTIYGDHDWYL